MSGKDALGPRSRRFSSSSSRPPWPQRRNARTAATSSPRSSAPDRRAALLCAIDAERTARGGPGVRANAQLALAAQGHADDMVARHFFEHVTPGGSTLGDRVNAPATSRGRRDWELGEAIAWAQQPLDTPATLMRAWLASPEHRAIILDRALPRRRGRRDGGADRRLGRARRHRRPGLRLPHLVAYAAAMALGDLVRAHGAHIAAQARSVRIDLDALEALELGDPPELDPQRHYLEGPAADVADYLLTLDAINFGSGWFPTLRKRAGSLGLLHRRVGARRPLARRRRLDRRAAARDAQRGGGRHARPAPRPRAHGHLRPGAARARRASSASARALDVVEQARGSAVRMAELLAGGMTMWQDIGFYKRAQIAPSDLALGGVAEFGDLDALTIFADNLVPHVLRCEGVLIYDEGLAAHIDAGRLLRPGPQEREIRGCAIHACAAIAQRTG